MSVRSASCSLCKTSVPVGPGFIPLRIPPYFIVCRNCKSRLKTSFNHRATWMSWLIWEIFWLSFTFLFAVVVIMKDYSIAETVGITAIGSLILGIGGGYILSLILAVPIQAVIDLTRAVLLKVKLIRGQEKENALEINDCEILFPKRMQQTRPRQTPFASSLAPDPQRVRRHGWY